MEDDIPTEINIITLNCWGLKWIADHRASRLAQIGQKLASADPVPHVVGLQECWTQEDYLAIRRATRAVLPYGKFYYGGAFGTGLAILSRWPIEESSMLAYPLNGRPTAPIRGDWFVGKGVACARVRYGPGPKHVLEIFNTHVSTAEPKQASAGKKTKKPEGGPGGHGRSSSSGSNSNSNSNSQCSCAQLQQPCTHGPYGPGSASYDAHRTSQAWQVAKLCRGAAERGHLVVAMGDFNMLPLSLAHRLIAAHGRVRDAWRVLHPDSSLGPADDPAERARIRPVPTAGFNLSENGATSDGAYCTWRWDPARRRQLERQVRQRSSGSRGIGSVDAETVMRVPADTPDPRGKRLDYIWAGTGDIAALGGGWVVKSVRVGMTERHPDLGCSLSDHFAIEATLAFHPRAKPTREEQEAEEAAAATASARARKEARKKGRTGNNSNSNNKSDSNDSAIGDATMMNSGAYLQSPTASEHALSSPSLTYDDQLRFPPGTEPQAADLLPISAYDDILAEVRAYTRRERAQKRWRALHFIAWLLVTVGCLVSVWFVPHDGRRPAYAPFVLMLATTLGFAWGVVDLFLSLLFFGAEIRALKEFEWEMVNARALASGGPLLQGGGDQDGGGDKGW